MDIELLSLDRLPLPSLEVYTFLSFLAASGSMYYFWAQSSVFYVQLMAAQNKILNLDTDNSGPTLNQLPAAAAGLSNNTNPGPPLTWHAVHWASQQPHCVWPLVNLMYCLLILLSHSVQKNVFGNLRASEQENVKDQFWNLVFYKTVFVFGVVNVQEVEDALGWIFFVSILVLLQIARQLSKERHNYLILMNDWTRDGEVRRRRILGLLFFIFFTSIALFLAVCGWYMSSAPEQPTSYSHEDEEEVPEPVEGSPYDFNLGLHSTVFMLCEIGLLVIQTFHALTVCVFDQVTFKYGLKFEDTHEDSDEDEGLLRAGPNPREEVNASIAHSINFYFDLFALLFDLLHHVHMLICCNLFLSMTSLIVSLQMRARVRQIHGILKKRQSYTWLTEHIDQYPDFQPGEFERDRESTCAICWDSNESQRPKVLPCKHTFHTACLRKWLLVSMNCPTCRLSLINEREVENTQNRRVPRRPYNPPPSDFWGFLQTGQTLLDLFGGWDPQTDEPFMEAPPPPGASLFGGFGVQDWTVVPSASTLIERNNAGVQKRELPNHASTSLNSNHVDPGN